MRISRLSVANLIGCGINLGFGLRNAIEGEVVLAAFQLAVAVVVGLVAVTCNPVVPK